MTMILGVIADDFTGATDVASMLVREGMRTLLTIGVPQGEAAADADAVVVALKSRTAPAGQAVHESLAAAAWLRAAGAQQLYFKVCSTFDSTPRGNIGPVADALAATLGADTVMVCPALPENGRTVYMGHLFVGTQLLSESSMREHPLTPMTDANLVRVLSAQTERPVGLVPHSDMRGGSPALREALAALGAGGTGAAYAIVDAIDRQDLDTIAQVACEQPLVVAGSGVALGLPRAYAARGWLVPSAAAARLRPVQGAAAVLAGSCSAATQAQVEAWRRSGRPAWQIDVRALAAGEPVARQALDWAVQHMPGQPVLVHATDHANAVRAIQQTLGVERASELVEQCLAAIAQGLVAAGVSRLVVAGGETSGAVVRELGVQRLRIGPSIAPGVPWTEVAGRSLWLALKSGNFGGVEFFAEALEMAT